MWLHPIRDALNQSKSFLVGIGEWCGRSIQNWTERLVRITIAVWNVLKRPFTRAETLVEAERPVPLVNVVEQRHDSRDDSSSSESENDALDGDVLPIEEVIEERLVLTLKTEHLVQTILSKEAPKPLADDQLVILLETVDNVGNVPLEQEVAKIPQPLPALNEVVVEKIDEAPIPRFLPKRVKFSCWYFGCSSQWEEKEYELTTHEGITQFKRDLYALFEKNPNPIRIRSLFYKHEVDDMQSILGDDFTVLVDLKSSRTVIQLREISRRALEDQPGHYEIVYSNGIREIVVFEQGDCYRHGTRYFPDGTVEQGRRLGDDGFSGSRCLHGQYTFYRPAWLASDRRVSEDFEGFAEVEMDGKKQVYLLNHQHEICTSVSFLDALVFPQLQSKRSLDRILTTPEATAEFFAKLTVPHTHSCFKEKLPIFAMNSDFLVRCYKIADQQGVRVDFAAPIKESLFLQGIQKDGSLWAPRDKPDSLAAWMLKRDPWLASIQDEEGNSVFALAVLSGTERNVKLLLECLPEDHFDGNHLSERMLKIAFLGEGEFTDEDFLSLTPQVREHVYTAANLYAHLPLVARLNTLGMKTGLVPLPPLERRLLSPTMDAVEAHESIQRFLVTQREKGCLLTQAEFAERTLETLPPSNKGQERVVIRAGKRKKIWRRKGSFSRLTGRDAIEMTIQSLGLKHIKVPRKIIVINERTDQPDDLVMVLERTSRTRLALETINADVYAEEIRESGGVVSWEEMEELLLLIHTVGFGDIHDFNFVIGKDGIYFIDTEEKSFYPLHHEKLVRLGSMLSSNDHERFVKRVQELEEIDSREENRFDPNYTDERRRLRKSACSRMGFKKRHRPFVFPISSLGALPDGV